MDVRIGKFKLPDGVQLHYEHWSPPAFDKVIVFVHGLGDHCGRYGPFVEYFTKKGYKVCCYDQRGHGRSEGKRVDIEKFEVFCDDLEEYVRFSRTEELAAFPWFLVGHSMGGQVVLNFLAIKKGVFQAACATSPNIEVALEIPHWLKEAVRRLLPLFPTQKLKGPAKPHLLSHAPEVVQAYVKDPLISTAITIRLANAILDNLKLLPVLCKQITTPLLMLHGMADSYCSCLATERFFGELILAQKDLKLYEGMYHELLNELNKEHVFEDIDEWFEKFV